MAAQLSLFPPLVSDDPAAILPSSIGKAEVCNVAASAGFGYADRPGVRRWMAAKGFATYADYVRAYKGIPHSTIQDEIEAFAFA